MRFLDRPEVESVFRGKRVAIVGSGPGSLENEPGFVDSHDVVVRVNNYKLFPQTGVRTDVFYSFFGISIKKSREELVADGVRLCMCKYPDAKFMESDWHRRNGRISGTDFRPIYQRREFWWFCDTYIPQMDGFLDKFELLGGHVPTTGFSAILDVLACGPRSLYLTGFDFFSSGVHNVNEGWRPGNPSDPIGHVPAQEFRWLVWNINRHPITTDAALKRAIEAPNDFRVQGRRVPQPRKIGGRVTVHNARRSYILQRLGNRHRVR